MAAKGAGAPSPSAEGECLCCGTCGATAFATKGIHLSINGELNRISLYHCGSQATFLDIPSHFYNGRDREGPQVDFKGFEDLRPYDFIGRKRKRLLAFWVPPRGHWMSSDKEVQALPFLVCRGCDRDCKDYLFVDSIRSGALLLDGLVLHNLFVRWDYAYVTKNVDQVRELYNKKEAGLKGV